MSLSTAEIAVLAREVKEQICPGRLDQIYQPSPTELTWKFRRGGESHLLLISTHPMRSRLHLLREAPPSPPAPTDFCRSLRGQLGGSILTDVEQVAADRIVRFSFEKAGSRLVVVAELMGRSSHLLLIDEGDDILCCLRPYRGKRRTLVPGIRYVVPARPADPRPSSVRDLFEGAEGPSRAAEKFYRDAETQARREERVVRLRRGLEKAEKKARSAVKKMKSSLEEAAEADRWQRMGEALKASLGSIRRGQSEAVLPDPFAPDAPPLRIPLDPSRTTLDNMSAMFRKARKLKRGRVEVAKRLRRAESQLSSIERARTTVAAPVETEIIDRMEEEARRRGWLPRTPTPKVRAKRRLVYRQFLSRDGLEIWVGRSARDNEEMTFRLARGEDLFLHVDGQPGSHVIVRIIRGKSVPEETLLDAAELAAHFSTARDQEKVQVTYTERKHVRSIRRGRTGQVAISRIRSLLLRREPDRLGRLLHGSGKDKEVLG